MSKGFKENLDILEGSLGFGWLLRSFSKEIFHIMSGNILFAFDFSVRLPARSKLTNIIKQFFS